MSAETRKNLIVKIAEACRMPCPDIRPIRHYRHKITGATHSPFGMPFNCRHEDYDLVLMGYAYADKNGVTYGTRGQSEAELRERFEAGNIRRVAEFAGLLAEMDDSRIESQADCWLPGWRLTVPMLTACVECGENAPESGLTCEECRETSLSD